MSDKFNLNELIDQVQKEESEKLAVFGDPRIEEGILSACMGRIERLVLSRSLLDTADFSVPGCRTIYTAMCELYEMGLSLDPATIANALKGRGLNGTISATIDKLWRLGADDIDLPSYCEIMREAARKRKCFALGRALQKMAQSRTPSEGIATKAEETIREIIYGYGAGKQVFVRAGAIRDALPGKDADILLPYGGQTAISTPIPKLNEKFDGFYRSALYVLGARTSVGKTALACQFARKASIEGAKTGYITLEMTREAILRRIVCTEIGIPRSEIKDMKRDGVPESARERARAIIDNIDATPLYFADRTGNIWESIRREVERMKMLCGISFVIIDYLQLIHLAKHYSNKTQEVIEISGNMKAMAKDLDLSVLVLSQIGRESVKRDDKRPQLSDLYFGSIENDADAVLMAHRPGLYDKNVPKSRAEIIIGKQREGEVGSIDVNFNTDYCRFEEPDPPYYRAAA